MGRKWGGVYVNDMELRDSDRAKTLIALHERLAQEGLKNVRSRYDQGRHQHLIYGEVS
jgi:hypothetical protein